MAYETIIVDKRDNIGILTLNRPDHSNGLTLKLVTEASDALEALAKDEEVRALIINGAGKNFCIGDAGEVEFLNRSALEVKTFLEASSRMIQLFADFPKGTVVAAHGLAVMTGTEIATLGDVTIAAEDARFGILGINYGAPCITTLHYIRQAVGPKKALELFVTGQMISADEALRIGLVSKVVPSEKLFEAAMETAKLLASKSPLAMAFAKRANTATKDMNLSEASRYLEEHLALLVTSEDGQEGIKASFEKRTPQWKGR